MLHSFILFFLFLFNVILYNSGVRMNGVLYLVPLFSIMLTLLYLKPKFRKGLIKIKVMYLVIFGILFFNIPWYLYSLSSSVNFTKEILFKYSIAEQTFVKSVFLLSISLILITLGYRYYYKKNKSIRKTTYYNTNPKKINIKPYKLIFYIIFTFLFLELGFSLGSLFSGNAPYLYTLLFKFMQLILIISIYNMINRKYSVNELAMPTKKFELKTVMIPLIIFSIFVLIGGDRGPVFSVLLIFVYGYYFSKNMLLKQKYILPIVLLVFFIYYTMGLVEALRLFEGNFNIAYLNEAVNYRAENERLLGNSSLCTNLAIKGIDKGLYPHTFGLFFIQSIIKGIPFLGNFINTALLGEGSVYIVGSPSLLTFQYHGLNPTSGIGTTYLADLYIEFGLMGVIFGSYILGIFLAFIDKKIENYEFKKSFDVFLVFTFVGQSFYLGRSTIYNFFPHFLSLLIFFFFIQIFIKTLKFKW